MAQVSGSSAAQASASIVETSLLLCEVIESWQSSHRKGALDGRLDWDEITSKMVERTGKPVLRSDLQTVWKYIAYGKRRMRDGDGESVTYSDGEEPFYQPFSAVKRHKVHATTQLQQKSEVSKKGAAQAAPTPPYGSQHVLASTVLDAMKTNLLCKQIQINIPEHVRLGNAGIQPPLYVPSSEMSLISSTLGKSQVRAQRNPRVARLAAQVNDALSAALPPAQPVMAHPTVVRPPGNMQTSQGGYVPGRGVVAASAGAPRPVAVASTTGPIAPVKPPGNAPISAQASGRSSTALSATGARPGSGVSSATKGGAASAQPRHTGSSGTTAAGRPGSAPVAAAVTIPAVSGAAAAASDSADAVAPPVLGAHQGSAATAQRGVPGLYSVVATATAPAAPAVSTSAAAVAPTGLPIPGVLGPAPAAFPAAAAFPAPTPGVPYPMMRVPTAFVLPPHLAAMYAGLLVPMGGFVPPPVPVPVPVSVADGTDGGNGVSAAGTVSHPPLAVIGSVNDDSSGTSGSSTGASNAISDQP